MKNSRGVSYFSYSPSLQRKILREDFKYLNSSSQAPLHVNDYNKETVKIYASNSYKIKKNLLLLAPVSNNYIKKSVNAVRGSTVLSIHKPILDRKYEINLDSLNKKHKMKSYKRRFSKNMYLEPILSSRRNIIENGPIK